MEHITRRQFLGAATALAATPTLAAARPKFRLNYILSSSMYGTLPLNIILPEVSKTGQAPSISGRRARQPTRADRGNGLRKIAALLKQHQTRLGCITRYDLGPFGLQKEMKVAQNFGAKVLVCGGRGRKGLKGVELKAEVKKFAELLKPHIAAAEKASVTIAIENHGNSLMDSPDS